MPGANCSRRCGMVALRGAEAAACAASAPQWWREGPGGDIWMATSKTETNYLHLTGDRLQHVRTETFYERFGTVTDRAGRSWGVWSNCLCSTDKTNPVRAVIPGYNGSGWRMLPSRDGGLWIIANRIQKFSQGHWLDCGPEPATGETFNGYIEDRNGVLWIGSDFGELWQATTNGVVRRFSLGGATTPQIGRGLLADAEGNIWVGTGGSGLYRLRPRPFRNYDSRNGLASDLARSVTQDGAGDTYIASINRIDRIPAGS